MMFFEALEGRRLLSAGTLDPTFGLGGTLRTDLPASFESASGVVVREDGRFFVGGTAYQDFVVLRYTSSGKLDTSFGNAGVARLNISGADQAHALAVQPDGRILVAGKSGAGAAVARFNTDGSPDLTFGDGGKVILAGMPVARAVLVQGEKILLAGESGDSAMVWRLNSDGQVDAAFGSSGVAAISGLSKPGARALAFDHTGRILMAGTAYHPVTDTDYLLVRFTADGLPDATLNGTGIVTIDLGVACNEAYALLVQPDGKIILAGDTCSGASIARVHEDGMLDVGFGSMGGWRDVFGTAGGGIASIALDSAGRVIVAGRSARDFTQFIVGRLNRDGTKDTTFGNNGLVTTLFDGWRGTAAAAAIQSNGRLLVAGEANSTFALARYITDPADTDFAPPTAAASAANVATAGATTYFFTVSYSPDVQPASLGDGDIIVSGPGGFRQAAALVGVEGSTASYALSIPGGWSSANNGVYTLALQDDQVLDLSGNAAAGTVLGSFIVQTPLIAPDGLLAVQGTAAADLIQLAHDGQHITVTINGVAQQYIAASVQRIEIRAGAGNDTVIVGPGIGGCWIDGGAGDDRLYGGDGNDTILGGAGNDSLYGGGGHDRLYGQDGDDLLDGGAGNDWLSGGPGIDTVTYATRRAALRISIDNKANDGQKGEKDNIRTDVENVTGGRGNDLIVGSRFNNILRGGHGNDTLIGNGGKDRLLGGPGKNVLK